MKEFKKLGNPFICDSPNELIQIDTRDIMPENVVNTINKIEDIGRKQAETFINDRIVDKKISINAPITKNKLPLISNKRSPGAAKSSVARKNLKRMWIFSQNSSYQPKSGEVILLKFSRRGKGIRRKVESDSKPQKDWMSFLRLNQNKT